MKVLVVDHEPLVRLSLRRALERAKHEVTEAEDGQKGLELWTESKPDLVFLDVLMPRLSGPDLLRKLEAHLKADTKVILMSAFTGEYDLAKAKSLGADLFIPKPFEDVFAIIRIGEELARGQSK